MTPQQHEDECISGSEICSEVFVAFISPLLKHCGSWGSRRSAPGKRYRHASPSGANTC